MMAQTRIRREADRDRLMPAIHRHQVDVEIDDQVGIGGALGEPDILAMIGLAHHRQLGAIFGVEVVEAIRPKLLERFFADHAANFRFSHAPMQRSSDDEVHIVDAVIRQRLHHLVEQAFANVGTAHRR